MRTHYTKALTSALCATTALGVLAVAAPAIAQEGFTEEILVTATRRAASLQDVPLAVTAVSKDQLQRNAIFDISNLDTLAPGLSFGASGSDARPSIRGARTETINERQDPVIGFFVDGFYLARTSQAFSAFFDLEQVEILRGPQGTLFGRNTFGGAVTMRSARPDLDEFDYSASIEYGSFDRIRAEAMINVPLTDTLAFRAAGVMDRDDGYITNLSNEAENFGQRDSDNLRVSMLWEPTDTFDATLRFRHWNQGGIGAGDFGYQVIGTVADATGTTTDVTGTFAPGNPRNGAGGVPLDPGPYEVFRDTPLTRTTDSYMVDLDLNWDLGFARLRSLTSYTDYSGFRQNDSDFSPAPGSFSSVDTMSETFTQELQILSPDDGGPLEWIAGAYFLQDDVREDFVFDGICALQDDDMNAITPRACVDNTYATPTTIGFGRSGNVDTTSYAFFGQATYSVTDELRVTGGIRYTNDNKEFSRFALRQFATAADINPGNPGVIFDPTDVALTNPETGEPFVEETFDRVTWRVGVEYDLTPDNLVYFTASTGFNSGGFNTAGQTVDQIAFGPQNVRAWEIGSKNSYPDLGLTLNISAYYNEFTELLAQGFTAVPIEGGGTTVVAFSTNAGDADVWGIEGEATWQPTDELTLAANFAYTNAELGNFILGNPFVQGGTDVTVDGTTFSNRVVLDGENVALTPDFTTTLSAQYVYDMGKNGTITPFLQFFYSTGYQTADIPFDGSIQGDYTKTDLTVTWMDEDERFSIAGYVQNLENEAVLNRTTVGGQDAIFANFARPRQWGIRFTVRR